MSRLYTPIWDLVKTKKVVKLEISHVALVSRVRRGIRKEKDGDLAFKVMEDYKWRLEMSYDKVTKQLTVCIKPAMNLELV